MKKYFDEIGSAVNFPLEEEKLLDRWYKKGTVKAYLEKNNKSDKYFSFLDGPITANNPMGVHHAWGRTYKDLWQRYHNMKGYKQRFQNGFDSQGLWVEVEVEKELGFRSKKDIEKYGIAKFVDKCKERVHKYADIQTQQSKRLGYFMDWDNSYFTMSDDNNYTIWHFIKVCNDNGWLYKGSDSVAWCPRCETAISQHEMLTEDYKEVVHDSVYLAFSVKGKNDEKLLIWTTTPWTIPANIAVAVDAKISYSLVQAGKFKYWVATDVVEKIFSGSEFKELKKVTGDKLEGMHYEGPFDDLEAVENVAKDNPETFHSVVVTDEKILPITTDEGTGLVHTAVSAGSEDFKLGQKYKLPMIPVITDNANYLPGLGFLTGQNAKKHPEIIIDHLKKLDEKGSGWLYKVERYKHRYPACWRCKTELVWKVTDEWYIAMDKPGKLQSTKRTAQEKTLRQRMVAVAKSIDWIPGFGQKRELDWLSNMHDWLISKKNRYWGLALPIWECDECGNFDVVGSYDELEKRAVAGWEKFKGKSPHKPQIDAVKIKCSKCGQGASRIEPVGNPWLDAGIVPYSTISSDNRSRPLYWGDNNEWRKWFPANFITESFPGQFKNWFYSLIAMSTVLENEKPFETVLGFATLLAEDGRPMHKSWGNSIEFNEGAQKIGVDVMRWMYVRQNPADNLLFGYKIADEVRRRFHLKLWNIYNFFITYANLDNWKPDEKSTNLNLENILDKWISVRLADTLITVESGLDKYNPNTAAFALEEFVDDLSNWYIRRSRERTGQTSLSDVDKNAYYSTTYWVLVTLARVLAPFTPFIAELIHENLTKETVHLSPWPIIEIKKDEDLIEDMKNIRMIVEKAHAIRKEKQIPVRQPLGKLSVKAPFVIKNTKTHDLLKDELNIKNILFIKGSDLLLELDTTITAELEEEAKTREIIRSIQQKRKEMGVSLADRVSVTLPWIPGNKDMLEKLKKTTLTTKLRKGGFDVEVVK